MNLEEAVELVIHRGLERIGEPALKSSASKIVRAVLEDLLVGGQGDYEDLYTLNLPKQYEEEQLAIHRAAVAKDIAEQAERRRLRAIEKVGGTENAWKLPDEPDNYTTYGYPANEP